MGILSTKEIRGKAEAKAQEGLGRQQVYDELSSEGTGLEAEPLARIVRYVPSLAARARFKAIHSILLVLLWITAVGKSLIGVGMALERGWEFLPFALLLPAVTVWIAVHIAQYRTRAYHTLGVLSAIGLFRFLMSVDWSAFDPWESIDLGVAAGLCGISWYLFLKVASNYEVSRAGDGRAVIIFPPEP